VADRLSRSAPVRANGVCPGRAPGAAGASAGFAGSTASHACLAHAHTANLMQTTRRPGGAPVDDALVDQAGQHGAAPLAALGRLPRGLLGQRPGGPGPARALPSPSSLRCTAAPVCHARRAPSRAPRSRRALRCTAAGEQGAPGPPSVPCRRSAARRRAAVGALLPGAVRALEAAPVVQDEVRGRHGRVAGQADVELQALDVGDQRDAARQLVAKVGDLGRHLREARGGPWPVGAAAHGAMRAPRLPGAAAAAATREVDD